MLFNRTRALAKMDEYGVDAVVAATPRNFYYVSEFAASVAQWGFLENLGAAVVARDPDKDAALVLPESFVGALLATPTWIPRVYPTEFMNTSIINAAPEPVRLDPLQADVERLYGERVAAPLQDNVILGTAAALRAMGLGSARVAFDDLRLAGHVSKELPGIEVVDAIDLMLEVRLVKTEEEIRRLRRGVAINEQAITDVIPLIRPGETWGEVARAYRRSVESNDDALVMAPERSLQFGAEYKGSYFPDVLVEYTSGWKVPERCPVIFESWGTYKSYAFDFSRTAYVGEPPEGYLDICSQVLAVWNDTLVPALRPGASTQDLYKAVAAAVNETSIPTPAKTLPFFHSIGLDIIEQPNGYPSLGRVKSWTLEENVVMNCELLYFGHSVAPYHIESTFLVTAGGAELLQTMAPDVRLIG